MIAQHGELLISAQRLAANVRRFRARARNGAAPSQGKESGAEICATLKANAYGHGVTELARLLRREEVRWACVYSLPEARVITEVCPDMRVLVLSPVVYAGVEAAGDIHRGDWSILAGYNEQVRLTLTDAPSAQRLARALAASEFKLPAAVHVQVDTGLTRAGVALGDAVSLIAAIEQLKELRLEGIYSHFSHGDEPGHATVAAQIERLWSIAGPVKQRRPDVLVHLQNSGGAWHVGGAGRRLDLMRVGIGLYGLQPSMQDPIADLEPVARLVAPILTIHERPAGVGVGYGHTFVTRRSSRLAIVPVGYGDGYPRAMSNRGIVQVRGVTAPVVGRVSMDQIVVDVTEIASAAVGDEVTVISDRPGDANSMDQIAEACGTIGYEIATGIGTRVSRRVVD